MTDKNKAPALFISHGAPTFALEPSKLGPLLKALGKNLNNIRAVLVISPHWQTQDVKVMTTAAPETVHDFGGFPPALYQLNYPAAGAPEIATEVSTLLSKAGWSVSVDDRRGLDHGAWVPMMHLLPNADVPVFQVSMPRDLTAASAYQLGQALAPLRHEGVLIVGSGSMTHNLYEFRQSGTKLEEYAIEFSNWVRQTVQSKDAKRLIDYRKLAPHTQRAHPSEEHFLPLLIAMGASDDEGSVNVLPGGVDHSVLSMESYAWGSP